MKIKLIKPTMVGAKQRKKGWTADVNIREAKTLISMRKAVSMEVETAEINLVVDVKNSDEFKKMENDLVEIADKYQTLLESLSTCTNIKCVEEIIAHHLAKE